MAERLLRVKKRYIAVKPTPDNLDENAVVGEVRRVFRKLFGEVELAESGFRRIRVKRLQGFIILACNHRYLPKIILSITLVRNIENTQSVLDVVTISGTLKGIKRRLATWRRQGG